MTDITELAQSLKAAAENAIGAHERLAAYPYGEIIDISQQEGEQIDIDITDINEFLEEASPANILALVDALEKAQQQNISDFEIKARLCKESNSLHDRLREADKRIAELESRTVKLPHRNLGHDKLFLLCPFPYYDAEDMEKALA
ncbi:TPA: ead/Ea22-like family protein, partial [Klebsiella pneumoniae]